MRNRVILLAILALVAAGAEQGAAWAMRARMRTAWEDWVSGLRAQGYAVSTGPVVSVPRLLGAALVVTDLNIGGGQAVVPGGFAWQARRLEMHLDLLHPTHLVVSPQADQMLRLAGGPPIVLAAEQLTATVKLGHGRADTLLLEADAVAMGPEAPGRREDFRIASLRLRLETERAGGHRTATHLTLHARELGLPDEGRWPLGATVSRLDLDALLASPALSGAAPAEQARAWHDFGGTLAVRQASLRWGPLRLDATGTLSLDDSLQPAGEGRAQVAGAPAALDALARAGTIPPGLAQAASAVLALMAPGAEPDGTAALDLPLALRDGTLSVGKLPITKLPPVDWSRI